MKIQLLFYCCWSLCLSQTMAQDTFSIVAADSTTREVGAAGASCIGLAGFGISDAGFLSELLPDTGAINTQASYLQTNQINARKQMRAGSTPEQIIEWLKVNDAQRQSGIRQYGIVGFNKMQAMASAFTGSDCIDVKKHITGNIDGIYYAIQGNILLNEAVLDSMEQRFRNTQGKLACRLMSAMQGAKIVGADSRCAPFNTSSLFAFLKVAQSKDQYGKPSFSVQVITDGVEEKEPIDSLQVLFDEKQSCLTSGQYDNNSSDTCEVYYSMENEEIVIQFHVALSGQPNFVLYNIEGKSILSQKIKPTTKERISTPQLTEAMYYYSIFLNGKMIENGKLVGRR